jgi:hypothetical protein
VVERRVAAGQQEAVGLGFAEVQGQFDGFDAVHTQAPGLDPPLIAQAGQHFEGWRQPNPTPHWAWWLPDWASP